MDGLIIWKTILIFLFLFFFLWIIFYTFQPDFLDTDDLAKDGVRGCTGDDCYLSAKGRTKIFLATIIPASIVSLLYYLISYRYFKTVTVKCDKNARKLGQCKIHR